jgi:acyl-coenzyme A thioesterase PaaI-like protein
MDSSSPGRTIARAWKRLHGLPGGRWLFSRLLGWMAPYTGSIRPLVLALAPGHARVQLNEHRSVRNHLRSVHAIALANLGEVTSGLALLVGLPGDARGIVTALSIEYFKKARGRLVAECRTEIPHVDDTLEHLVYADIHDSTGDRVARTTVRWRIARARTKSMA